EMAKHQVVFQPVGGKVEVEQASRILEAAAESGIYINSLCGGEGVCGKCRVQITRGEARPTSQSIRFLSREEINSGFVLACQTEVKTNLEVWVPPEARLEEQQILTTESMVCYDAPQDLQVSETFDIPSLLYLPVTKKLYLSLPEPSISDNISDLDRVYREIRKKIEAPYLETSLSTLRGLAELLRESKWQVTATLHPYDEHCIEILSLEPGDTCAENYGIACDIGTTTIVVQLVDLRSGATLGVEASHNQQAKYGEDVISRMIFACGRGGLSPIHNAVIDSVNALIDSLLEKHGVAANNVTALTAAGNTTMTHLFMGLEPCTIRLEPYIPTANFLPTGSAEELNLHLHPKAVVTCLPGVSSYVGGDITAGVLASGISNSSKVSALIDIGTNGEIVIGNNEWLVCCSASAGPAFEGSGTKCGMRATRGAIQKVYIESDQVRYETIGGAKARGICGSGLIDTIAELFRNRIIDPSGKFPQESAHPRVQENEDDMEFVLASGDETKTGKSVVITESDISNLIKSKGAILAAMRVMLNSVGMSFESLERIFVAGGFGNYLDVEKAIFIGLLPDVPPERVKFIGNSSLTGARMGLLSRHAFERANTLARQMTYFELSVDPKFYDEFVAALFLPHTDMDLYPSVKRMMGS
ncbi:MAG: ASKHA domain-containing protein, partial [Syntrophobacterales bacterium]